MRQPTYEFLTGFVVSPRKRRVAGKPLFDSTRWREFMRFRSIALAALAVTSLGAQAALTTYAPWDLVSGGGTGLAGVKFNVVSSGSVTIAMGAHAYKNGVLLPNNGVDTYYAQPGLYAPDGLNRANWSFDFAWDLGGCTTCTVALKVDTDPTAAVNLVTLFDTAIAGTNNVLFGSAALPDDYFQSWNMEMAFMNGALGYNFNPFGASSTAFSLMVTDSTGIGSATSDITVNVPEPGSLLLAGLALAGLAGVRRRKA